MTKTQLSSDLDLVKEIEQLRIKQKLLLQTFKDNDKKSNQEELLKNISAQVQFLVEIFKEVNSTDKPVDGDAKDKHVQIMEQIDSMKTIVLEKFEIFEKKLDDLENKPDSHLEKLLEMDSDKNTGGNSETISQKEIEEVFIPNDGEITESTIGEKKSINKNELTPLDDLPKPDFEVSTKEKKKTGWFS